MLRAHAADLFSVTVWGLTTAAAGGPTQAPLLFDDDLQAKPAYYGRLDAALPARLRTANVFQGDVPSTRPPRRARSGSSCRCTVRRRPRVPAALGAGPPHGVRRGRRRDDAAPPTRSTLRVGETIYAPARRHRRRPGGRRRTGATAGRPSSTCRWPPRRRGGTLPFDVRSPTARPTSAGTPRRARHAVARRAAVVRGGRRGRDGPDHRRRRRRRLGGRRTVRPTSRSRARAARPPTSTPSGRTTRCTSSRRSPTRSSTSRAPTRGPRTPSSSSWTRATPRTAPTAPTTRRSGSTPTTWSRSARATRRSRRPARPAPRVVADGYVVEAAISLLEDGGAGTFQGLDFQVNDGTGGARTSIRNWADPTGIGYQTTARWGVGRLVARDGTARCWPSTPRSTSPRPMPTATTT